MFKKIFSAVVLCTVAAAVWAYTPPAAGQMMYQISTPDVLSGGATIAGGAFEYSAVSHAIVNPALTASEQRIVADLGVTLLSGTLSEKKNALTAPSFYIGLAIPTKTGVYTVSGQSLTAGYDTMALGNTFTARGGFAKEMGDHLNVGIDTYVSLGKTGVGFDWALGSNLGFTWNMGTPRWLPFMTDVRWGATISDLGKNLRSQKGSYSAYPGIFTPGVGIAGTLFSAKAIKGAVAFDMTAPSFMDIGFNTVFDVRVAEVLSVKTGWNFDLKDTLSKKAGYLPYVTVGFTFGHTSKDTSLLAKKGYKQNEFNVSGAWRQMTEDVHAFGAGATVKLGLPDKTAPEISLWEDEE